jgi:HEAT repeat protein
MVLEWACCGQFQYSSFRKENWYMRFYIIMCVVALVSEQSHADEKKAETLGDKQLAKLVKILENGEYYSFDEPAKADAVTALGLLGDERAVPVLIARLENEEKDVLRLHIIRALGWTKSPKAVPALEKTLKNDRYAQCRRLAAIALTGITGNEYSSEKEK